AVAGAVVPAAAFLAPEGAPEQGDAPRRLALLGLAIFALGTLPVAISDYTPDYWNHFNRLNQVPLLGLVLCAAAFARIALPRAGARVGAALAAFFIIAHAGFASVWAEAYRRELLIRDLVAGAAPYWPADKTLMLLEPRLYVDKKAPIFLANWDITGAVRLWTGDPGRQADVVGPGMRFTSTEMVSPNWRKPY